LWVGAYFFLDVLPTKKGVFFYCTCCFGFLAGKAYLCLVVSLKKIMRKRVFCVVVEEGNAFH